MAKEKAKPAKAPKKIIKKATKSKAKKKWVQIIGPKSFNNVVLGESHVSEAEKLVGKTITANLMNLTGDMRKQGIEIRFDVLKVVEGKGVAATMGYELLPSGMKRLIRRGRSKVGDSFITTTATGRKIRMKPLIITTNPASAKAQTTIRLAAKERFKVLAKSMSFDKLVQELIQFKLQRTVKDELSKIHPIKSVDIRSCYLLREGSEEKDIKEDTRDEDFIEVIPEKAAVEEEEIEEESADEPEEDLDEETDDGVDEPDEEEAVDVKEPEAADDADEEESEEKKDE